MDLKQRMTDFVRLGALMRTVGDVHLMEADKSANRRFKTLIERERHHNGWFTPKNVQSAFRSMGESMTEKKMKRWLAAYPTLEETRSERNVGLVLAGNIPLVGFHDVLCTLLSGHHALIKCSRDDNRLLPVLLEALVEINQAWASRFTFIPHRLEQFDAVIATGSNNTARYFEQYFSSVPHIIRKNRSSVAVLNGEESPDELEAFGEDVFAYFGLGCRNVTKVFLPQDFDIDRLFAGFYPYRDIINHAKYANNYDYHKALWLLNRDELIENGFLLVKEDEQLVSPVGSLFLHRYKNEAEVSKWLEAHRAEVQCVVGRKYILFGEAQQPELWDYADAVDTMAFLCKL